MAQQEVRNALLGKLENEALPSPTLTEVLRSQAQSLRERLSWARSRSETTNDLKEKTRQECRQLEEALGIHNSEQRILEAALFIDLPFLQLSLLRNDEHPEELFGLEAWKGWLSARVLSRKMDSLSLSHIKALHELLATNLPGNKRGQIRSESVASGDASHPGASGFFTEDEHDALEQNPYLIVCPDRNRESHLYIFHPTMESKESLEKASLFLTPDQQRILQKSPDTALFVQYLLEEACAWYIEASSQPNPRPAEELAAELQRRIISIHPYEDCNGRLSRLLMTWCLEKHGQTPSIVAQSEKDLDVSFDQWVTWVRGGQRLHEALQERCTGASEAGPAEVFFSLQEIAFFQVLFAPNFPPQSSDKPLRHKQVREYLASFAAASAAFRKNCEYQAPLGGDSEPRITGGFIPPEYIALWGDTRPAAQEVSRARFFYPDVMTWRGGKCVDIKSPEDLLTFFQAPSGFTSSYDVSTKANISALSQKQIPLENVRRELEQHNAILAYDTSTFPDALPLPPKLQTTLSERVQEDKKLITDDHDLFTFQNAVERGTYLSLLLEAHTKGSTSGDLMWLSPGVSTSTDEAAGYKFVPRLYRPEEKDSRGILIRSLLPKQGIYYSPVLSSMPVTESYKPFMYDNSMLEAESEVLPMGGVDPNAIQTVEMFDPFEKKLIAFAQRTKRNALILVDLKSQRRSTYVFSQDGTLVLKERALIPQNEIEILQDRGIPEGSDEYSFSLASPSTADASDIETLVSPKTDSFDEENIEDEILLASSLLAKKISSSQNNNQK